MATLGICLCFYALVQCKLFTKVSQRTAAGQNARSTAPTVALSDGSADAYIWNVNDTDLALYEGDYGSEREAQSQQFRLFPASALQLVNTTPFVSSRSKAHSQQLDSLNIHTLSNKTGQTLQYSISKDVLKIIENSTLYDYHASPTQGMDKATNVTISMYIEGLSSFSAQTMDFHVDIYLQERWHDPRLMHKNKDKILIKDLKLWEKIWHPDLYFANAREASFHTVTAPNFLTWIYPNGSIYYDTRVSLTVMCMMDLAKYPLDIQRCHIRILSYAYDEEQLNITWVRETDPIGKNDDIMLPDMHLLSIRAAYCDGFYENLGRWSCVSVHFVVRREIMQHFLQSYIPTALIVAISWFSFWLDVDSVPGRVSLFRITRGHFHCISRHYYASDIGNASICSAAFAAAAIDVWLGACLAFVFDKAKAQKSFIQLLEITIKPNDDSIIWARQSGSTYHDGSYDEVSAAVNALTELSNLSSFTASKSKAQTLPCTCTDSEPDLSMMLEQKPLPGGFPQYGKQKGKENLLAQRQGRKLAIKIDRYCRALFPIGFIVFNSLYWPYYIFSPESYVGTKE